MNAPKISKANIAYITSVIALCFSTSIWSLNNCCVQVLFCCNHIWTHCRKKFRKENDTNITRYTVKDGVTAIIFGSIIGKSL